MADDRKKTGLDKSVADEDAPEPDEFDDEEEQGDPPASSEPADPKGSSSKGAKATASQAAEDEERRKRKRRAQPSEAEPEDRDGFWDRGLGRRLEGMVPDVVKRTLVGSLGSLFMSEDGLRQSLTELRLPKEIVTFILQQADNTKRDFMKLVAREMRDFLESTNFYDELRKILTGLSFEIRTEVRLIPNENAFVKPDVKNTIKVKKREPREEPPEDE